MIVKVILTYGLPPPRALHNALGFAHSKFSNEMERDFIMRVVFEETLSSELEVRLAAFGLLVSIGSTYYEVLAPYIKDIFIITYLAIRKDEEAVALQAIEFWSSICEIEIDVLKRDGVIQPMSHVTILSSRQPLYWFLCY